ncbi:MAG TPA: mersacidin/lichenicidin family type 2 lantibiotic [Ktedonobacteraceae bacterium]|jgi:mersacidin/lichenicidin family type 2 lantibiotic
MNPQDIIRAWKDRTFRQSLSRDEQALVPDHPAGEITLSEAEQAHVYGGIPQVSQLCEISGPPHCTPRITCL